MIISINSHDVLGKLSIIKNYISVLEAEENLSDSQKKLIAPVQKSTQELINYIKSRIEKKRG